MQASRSSLGTPKADKRVAKVRLKSCGEGGSSRRDVETGSFSVRLSQKRDMATAKEWLVMGLFFFVGDGKRKFASSPPNLRAYCTSFNPSDDSGIR